MLTCSKCNAVYLDDYVCEDCATSSCTSPSDCWEKRKDTHLAVWEYRKNGELLLTLAYEGVTDLANLPMRDYAWALMYHGEREGQRRWTFRAGTPAENIPAMMLFGESLLPSAPTDRTAKAGERSGL
jgi:hypothetical protein